MSGEAAAVTELRGDVDAKAAPPAAAEAEVKAPASAPPTDAHPAVERMWADDAASRDLGMRLEEVRPGYARVAMTVEERMLNGHRIAHGGFVFALADSTFALACNSHGPATVAAHGEITFLAASHLGDELVAEAVERVRYGRSGIYDVSVRDSGDRVVAEFRGHSRTLRDSADS